MGKKFTYEEVKEYIEQFEYTLLSTEYIDNKSKLLVQCPNLNHEPYEVRFDNFKTGRRCPYCANEARINKIKKDYQEIKEYIESFGYRLLSTECNNAHEKLKMICPFGHKCEINWNNFKSGKRCPHCRGNAKHTYKYVKEYIESFGYKLLSGEYKNSHTKLLVQCDKGHKYEVTFDNFKTGYRCPICNVSKGERRIIDWLDDNNIEYIYEKTFEKLLGVGGGNLSYDFYLPNYNLLIEYQGEYHDGSVLNETKEQFEKQQEHDRRKREYAKDNRYNLLEIWNWDFDNIEEILEKYLK